MMVALGESVLLRLGRISSKLDLQPLVRVARGSDARPLSPSAVSLEISYSSAVTRTIAKPSYPLLPSVWIAVALTRDSAESNSLKRRMP